MTVHTNKIRPKLEKVVEFRLGDGASKKYPIQADLEGGLGATDGNKIFLAQKEKKFNSDRDNELAFAFTAAHEADHIADLNEYFGSEIEILRNSETSLVAEFNERNFEDLEENPELADWLANIVDDTRIDTIRRKQLPGIDRFFKDTLMPAAEYLRPSIKKMDEFNAFREQLFQKMYFNKTIEPVPKKHRKLLDELAKKGQSTESIYDTPETVKYIYNKLKENFDITQPINDLPPSSGTKRHKERSSGRRSKKKIQEREGRDPKEKKPKKMKQDGSPSDEDKNKKEEEQKDQGEKPLPANPKKPEDRKKMYEKASGDHNIDISMTKEDYSATNQKTEDAIRCDNIGIIESMKRLFKRLKQNQKREKRAYVGENLDLEEFLQSRFQSRITRIKKGGKYFIDDKINEQKSAWAVLADVSPSTDPSMNNIIIPIKTSTLIMAEALSASENPFGLYAFAGDLSVIKDTNERYSPRVANKIIAAKRKEAGTYIAHSLRVVGDVLKKQRQRTKGITVITDGQPSVSGMSDEDAIVDTQNAIEDLYNQRLFPFIIIIGKEFEEYGQRITANIGHEHYCIVEKDKLYELPYQMMRLFKTYGLAR